MSIKTYTKGATVQLSKNFKSTEFDCHGCGCCTSTLIDDDLIKYVQKIREHFNKPITITSGYRCPTHNSRIGGATGSRHSKGQAADIVVSGVASREVAKYAESIGIKGIGLYETNADGHFTHIDTRSTKSFWYGQKEAPRTTFGGTPIQEEETKIEEVKIDTSKINTSTPDPKIIWDYCKKQGLNDYGIAGLMGNLEAESGLKPINLQNTYEKKLGLTDAEYTAAVDQGIYTNFAKDSAGYGLAQWTYYTRKQNLLTYCQTKNKSVGNLEAQLDFLFKELSTNYTNSVLNVLKNAKSVLEASNAVLINYECPADQSTTMQKNRAALGQNYYNKYASKTTITIPDNNINHKMKYSVNNKPLICMQTQSTCYKGTSKMNIKGVLWHSTGANNPNLKRYVQPSDNDINKTEMLKLLGINSNKNDWNHIERQAGLNAWIGKLADGTVTSIQTMPWNYKPWGCGSGSKGSCNNGWIQFEICEDGLTDKVYFNKIYKEACELTAYLCTLYNIDPKKSITINGVNIPTILCHADSCKLGFGSNHGDVLHWFSKFGKTMEDVRNDVAKLMNLSSNDTNSKEENKENTSEIYRVRIDWDNVESQIGAYTVLKNAINACDKAGKNYKVFNSKGILLYPKNNKFSINDIVKLIPGATYTSGQEIPNWLFKNKLYVREIYNNDIVISTQKTGDITGIVSADNLTYYDSSLNNITQTFTPYLVKINTSVLNVRAGAGTNYKITTQVKINEVYTIVDENGDWGKLKSGAGWINLAYTKKV